MISRGLPRATGRVTDRARVLMGPVPVTDPNALSQTRVAKTTVVIEDPDGEQVDPRVVEWTYRARTFGETDETIKSPPLTTEADGVLRDISVSSGSGATTVEVFANGSLVASVPTGTTVRRLDRWLFAGSRLEVRATSTDAVALTVDLIVEGA